MTEEHEPDETVVGGAGITAGGDVNIGAVSGQVAIGENITQNQSILPTDLNDLRKSLLEFQKGLTKLSLSTDDQNIVTGDISAAIKEANKDKPELSNIKMRFESIVNTVKEAGKTIKDISDLYEPAKKIANLVGMALLI
jgi:chaperonin cofactor prefoldin